jgi:hypothetical protein
VDSSYLDNQDEGTNVIFPALCSSVYLLTETFSTSEHKILNVN